MDDTALLKSISKIYDATIDTNLWSEVLVDITDLVGMENAALVTVDETLNFSNVIAPRADPSVIEAFNGHWWQKDPMGPIAMASEVGEIFTLENCGPSDFFKSEFYNDFWRKSGLGGHRIASNLLKSEGAFSSLVFQTSVNRDEITDKMRAYAQALVPHLIRAQSIAQTIRKMEFSQASRLLFQEALSEGILFVDENCQILHADEGAATFLTSGKILRANDGFLSLSDTVSSDALQHSILTLSQGINDKTADILKPIIIDKTNLAHSYTITILPYPSNPLNLYSKPATAIINIQKSDAIEKRELSILRDKLGFTPAEARLAREMLKGDGREAAAMRCQISVNTARTHLTRIFEKADVKRQAELLSVLFSLLER